MNGWEPREFTEYVYEGDRLVRTVTTREAEWTPDEVSALIASRIIEADIGPHGHPLSESTSPLANPSSTEARWKYVASERPRIDYAAKALGDAQDAYRDKWGKDRPLPHGLLFSVDRIELNGGK